MYNANEKWLAAFQGCLNSSHRGAIRGCSTFHEAAHVIKSSCESHRPGLSHGEVQRKWDLLEKLSWARDPRDPKSNELTHDAIYRFGTRYLEVHGNDDKAERELVRKVVELLQQKLPGGVEPGSMPMFALAVRDEKILDESFAKLMDDLHDAELLAIDALHKRDTTYKPTPRQTAIKQLRADVIHVKAPKPGKESAHCAWHNTVGSHTTSECRDTHPPNWDGATPKKAYPAAPAPKGQNKRKAPDSQPANFGKSKQAKAKLAYSGPSKREYQSLLNRLNALEEATHSSGQNSNGPADFSNLENGNRLAYRKGQNGVKRLYSICSFVKGISRPHGVPDNFHLSYPQLFDTGANRKAYPSTRMGLDVVVGSQLALGESMIDATEGETLLDTVRGKIHTNFAGHKVTLNDVITCHVIGTPLVSPASFLMTNESIILSEKFIIVQRTDGQKVPIGEKVEGNQYYMYPSIEAIRTEGSSSWPVTTTVNTLSTYRTPAAELSDSGAESDDDKSPAFREQRSVQLSGSATDAKTNISGGPIVLDAAMFQIKLDDINTPKSRPTTCSKPAMIPLIRDEVGKFRMFFLLN